MNFRLKILRNDFGLVNKKDFQGLINKKDSSDLIKKKKKDLKPKERTPREKRERIKNSIVDLRLTHMFGVDTSEIGMFLG